MSSNLRAPAGHFRAHTRLSTRLRAIVTNVESGRRCEAPVADLGLGGARVLVDERIVPGEVVTLAFAAPTRWDPLLVPARAVWVSSGGPPLAVGVAFQALDAETLFAVYELIATLFGYD